MEFSRRNFFQSAATAAAATAVVPVVGAAVPPSAKRKLTEAEKLARIAVNTYPLRWLFPSRNAGGRTNAEYESMQKKYGKITLLELPEFAKKTFPGVYHVDVWSSLFGDVSDSSMFETQKITFNGAVREISEFDPATASGKRWLEKAAAKYKAEGVRIHHISNNAPRNICDPDASLRKQGIEVAKKWLDAGAIIGAKTMRVNSGGPRLVPGASSASGSYPKNDQIEVYLKHAIDSFKEMADHGEKVGVKVTVENHWGLTADPTNIRIIIDGVNSPWCEASPDFCNWEHEYMLYHGLAAVAPYAHTTVHAKYWDRWKNNDVQRSTRVMEESGFQGIYALEYEAGPWDGVEGAKHLLKEVTAAL